MDDRDLSSIYLKYLQKSSMCTCNLQCQKSQQCSVHVTRGYPVTSGHINYSNRNNKHAVVPPTECLIHYEPHDVSPNSGCISTSKGYRSAMEHTSNSSISNDQHYSDNSDGDDVVADPQAFQEAYLASTKADLSRTYEDSGLDLSDKEPSPRSSKHKGQTTAKLVDYTGKVKKILNGVIPQIEKSSHLTEKQSLVGDVSKVPSARRRLYEKDDSDTMSMTSLEVADIMAFAPSSTNNPNYVERTKMQYYMDSNKINTNQTNISNSNLTVPPSVKRKSKKGLNNFIEQSLRSFMDQPPPNTKLELHGEVKVQGSNTVGTERYLKATPTIPTREDLNRLRQLVVISPQSSGSSDTGSIRTMHSQLPHNLNSNNSSPLYSMQQITPSVGQTRSLTYRNNNRTVRDSYTSPDSQIISGQPSPDHAQSITSENYNQQNHSRKQCSRTSSCSGSSHNSEDVHDNCQDSDKYRYSISLTTLLLSGYQISHVKVHRRDEEFTIAQYTTHVVKDSSIATARPNSTSSHGTANQKTCSSHVIVISDSRSLNGNKRTLLPMDILIEVR